MRVWLLAGVGLAGLLGSGFAAVPAASAAATKPAIVSLAAAPPRIPAEGGSVRVTVRVRRATSCTFRHQPTQFAALRRDAVVRCASGTATYVISVAANRYRHAVTLRFEVRAASGAGTVVKAVSIMQAAAPAPLAVATTELAAATVGTPYSATLAATGGTPPYTWTLASGSLPLGLSLDRSGAISGTPTSSGPFPLTVRVRDAARRTATAALSLAVTGPLQPVGTMHTSSNWSGYVLDGSSFTFVTGTFTVPSVGGASGSASTAEWIGIDGDSDTNQDLIQAGVAEDADPSGNVQIYAWWEILPAAATPIDSIEVSAGDTVTVTIRQLAPGSWTIQVVDATNDQSFTTTQSYNGQGRSAEWIVEAPSTTTGRVLTLGPYSPPVTFTGIGWAGTPTSGFAPIQLQQRGSVVSVPSALDATQTSFVVAYGSTAPQAPA